MRRLIDENDSDAALERYAGTLRPGILEDGWRKCLAGLTSTEEVLRVKGEE